MVTRDLGSNPEHPGVTELSTLNNNRLVGRKGDRLVVHPWLLHGPSAAQ
jgi:hypothetical protein